MATGAGCKNYPGLESATLPVPDRALLPLRDFLSYSMNRITRIYLMYVSDNKSDYKVTWLSS